MQKNILILLVILGITYASNMKCMLSERQNKVCTREYRPVCGISVSSTTNSAKLTKTTYGNRCTACSEESVAFIAEGACEDYPEQATFCHPDAGKQKFCTREYMPVCGLFDQSVKCIRAPCALTFSNKCGACTAGNIAYYIPGSCEAEEINY